MKSLEEQIALLLTIDRDRGASDIIKKLKDNPHGHLSKMAILKAIDKNYEPDESGILKGGLYQED